MVSASKDVKVLSWVNVATVCKELSDRINVWIAVVTVGIDGCGVGVNKKNIGIVSTRELTKLLLVINGMLISVVESRGLLLASVEVRRNIGVGVKLMSRDV